MGAAGIPQNMPRGHMINMTRIKKRRGRGKERQIQWETGMEMLYDATICRLFPLLVARCGFGMRFNWKCLKIKAYILICSVYTVINVHFQQIRCVFLEWWRNRLIQSAQNMNAIVPPSPTRAISGVLSLTYTDHTNRRYENESVLDKNNVSCAWFLLFFYQ